MEAIDRDKESSDTWILIREYIPEIAKVFSSGSVINAWANWDSTMRLIASAFLAKMKLLPPEDIIRLESFLNKPTAIDQQWAITTIVSIKRILRRDRPRKVKTAKASLQTQKTPEKSPEIIYKGQRILTLDEIQIRSVIVNLRAYLAASYSNSKRLELINATNCLEAQLQRLERMLMAFEKERDELEKRLITEPQKALMLHEIYKTIVSSYTSAAITQFFRKGPQSNPPLFDVNTCVCLKNDNSGGLHYLTVIRFTDPLGQIYFDPNMTVLVDSAPLNRAEHRFAVKNEKDISQLGLTLYPPTQNTPLQNNGTPNIPNKAQADLDFLYLTANDGNFPTWTDEVKKLSSALEDPVQSH